MVILKWLPVQKVILWFKYLTPVQLSQRSSLRWMYRCLNIFYDHCLEALHDQNGLSGFFFCLSIPLLFICQQVLNTNLKFFLKCVNIFSLIFTCFCLKTLNIIFNLIFRGQILALPTIFCLLPILVCLVFFGAGDGTQSLTQS
jgi:hypothetical protein